MATRIACPHCDASLRIEHELPAGKKLTCPKCKKPFPVPGERDGARDDDEQPRREKKPARADDEDDDANDRRPRRGRGKKKRASAGGGRMAAIIAVLVVVLAGGGVGLYYALKDGKKSGSGGSSDAANNQGTQNPKGNPDGGSPIVNNPIGGGPVGGLPLKHACVYDDALTKYLPEGTRRIEVIDFHESRAHPSVDVAVRGALEHLSFGNWVHKDRGIGSFQLAGIAESDIKSMTLLNLPETDGYSNVGYIRFTKAPDPNKLVQALQGTVEQIEGKTYYRLDGFRSTPLHHLHALELQLYVFGHPNLIPKLALARAKPVVSPDLIEAIKATRGPLPVAAQRVPGAGVHINDSLFNYFRFFSRADNVRFSVHEKARWVAYSRVPSIDGMTVSVHAQHDDVATAEAAEKKAAGIVQNLRGLQVQGIPSLQQGGAYMFANVQVERQGTLVTLSWPFTAIMVERFYGPPKNWR